GVSATSPLSLHDALPISFFPVCASACMVTSRSLGGLEDPAGVSWWGFSFRARGAPPLGSGVSPHAVGMRPRCRCGAVALLARSRSEEHTSELQSRENLVC